MNVVISSRHMDVTPAMKTFAEEKVRKLLRYFDLIQEIEVVFDNDNHHISCEVLVNAEHNKEFVAKHTGTDAYACVDSCVDKLERQLTDYKEKWRNRKHPEGGATIRHSHPE